MRRLFTVLGVRRARMERDLDRELRYHLDRRVDDLRAGGLDEARARRQAALEFGNIAQVQEDVRDVWLTRWLRDFLADLRFSARSLRRSPSFTATALLSLALGIGATTAIYSLADQVILHVLPVREPERLVLIDWKGEQATVNAFGTYNLLSYPLCRNLDGQRRFFDGVLCRAATIVTLSTGADARPAAAEIVSGTYFAVLGVRPFLGRVLTPDDDRVPGTSSVVVLSHDFWETQLGSAPDVIGRKVSVNRHPMTIVGVAAPAFRGIDVGQVPSLWIPASMSAEAIPEFENMLNRRVRWMQALGRLKPGVTQAKAQAGLQPWFKAMLLEDTRGAEFPVVTAERKQRFLASMLELTPAAQGHSPLRRQLARPLWVLLAATAMLLSLACLNVAGLFVARGSARGREISTRLALGASRGRIGRQLLADSLAIAGAGGALGVVLAPFAMRALITFLPADVAPTALQTAIDRRLLLSTLAISVVTGLATGAAAAWQASRGAMMPSLRDRTAAGGELRLRRTLVTMQVAFTLILVVGALLFARTLTALSAKGPGFDTSSLIAVGIDPRRNGASPAEAARLTRRIFDDIRAAPQTQRAAVSRVELLTGGSWNNRITVEAGRRITTDREVHLNAVSPGFFATLGTVMLVGRDFAEHDSERPAEDGWRVAIVNDAFAKRYLTGRTPLGARIGIGAGPDTRAEVEVVGVVANISYRAVREEWEQVYFPIISPESGTFYVRVQGTPDAAFRSIRAIIQHADPTLPVRFMRTLDEQVGRSLSTERMLAALTAAFGALALLLALVGLYGVIAFTVSQRTREIGVRMALGATRRATVWLVLRDALLMVGAGTAVALPCVCALGRVVQSQLYEVTPTDPTTIAAATALLGGASLAAALIPACRAAAVNPTDALRCE
jgi:predicted permease